VCIRAVSYLVLVELLFRSMGARWVWGVDGGSKNIQMHEKTPQNRPPKNGFGDRQVGAFCKNRSGDTETPFIFCPFSRFFRFSCRFRG